MENNFIMKLTQLEYFCVAARYHNITKAAKELFVTQPSISNAIHQNTTTEKVIKYIENF